MLKSNKKFEKVYDEKTLKGLGFDRNKPPSTRKTFEENRREANRIAELRNEQRLGPNELVYDPKRKRELSKKEEQELSSGFTTEEQFKEKYNVPEDADFGDVDFTNNEEVEQRFEEQIEENPDIETQIRRAYKEYRDQTGTEVDTAPAETPSLQQQMREEADPDSFQLEEGTFSKEEIDESASKEIEGKRSSLSSNTVPENAQQGNLTARQNRVVMGTFRRLLPKIAKKQTVGEKQVDSVVIVENNEQAAEFIEDTFGANSASQFNSRTADAAFREEGVHVGGVTILIADNMAGANVKETTDRMAEVLFHEEIGHRGLRGFFGDGFNDFLDKFDSGINKTRINKWLNSKEGAGYKDSTDRREQIEEYIVKVHAEKGARKVGLVEGLVFTIRKMFGSGQYTDTALKKAFQAIEKDFATADAGTLLDGILQPGQENIFGDVRFSRKPNLERDPEVVEAVKDYEAGKITQDEYNKVVREKMPIRPIPKEEVEIATIDEINTALKPEQIETGIYKKDSKVEDKISELGNYVAARLDIPAYSRFGTWVVSLHDGTKKGGSSIGYSQTAYLTGGIVFESNPKLALKVAKGPKEGGMNKSTFARMFGTFQDHDPQALFEKAKRLMESDEWIQVGMNPFRHSYFYDKADGNPVIKADEVIQVGALVLAKNATKTTPKDNQFLVKGTNMRFSRVFRESLDKTQPGETIGSIRFSKQLANGLIVPDTVGDLTGKRVGITKADRMARGDYVPIHSQSKRLNGRFMYGGPLYATDPSNLELAAWSSTPDATLKNTKYAKANTDGLILGIVGAADQHMSNVETFEIFFDENLDAVDFGNKLVPGNPKPDINWMDQRAIDVAKQVAAKNKKYQFLNNIKGFEDLRNQAANLTFDIRKEILDKIGNKVSTEQQNLVTYDQITRRTSDFPNAQQGDAVVLLQLDTKDPRYGKGTYTAKELGVPQHPTYDSIIKGTGVATMNVPMEIWAKEFFRGTGAWTQFQDEFKNSYEYTRKSKDQFAEWKQKQIKMMQEGKLPADIIPQIGPAPKREAKVRIAKQKRADALRSFELMASTVPSPDKSINLNKETLNALTFRFSKALDPQQNPEMRFSLREHWHTARDFLTDKVKRNLETFGKLPERERYLHLRRLLKGQIYNVDKGAKALYDVLSKTENPKPILDFFETRDASPSMIADQAEREAAVKAKDLIERIGRRAVSVGLLKPQQYARYKGEYLPRLYLRHILGEDGENLARNNLRMSNLDWGKKRGDIPEAIRRLVLGQIEDPAYLAQRGIAVPGRDLAVTDFLAHISTNPEWVDQSNLAEFNTLEELRAIVGESEIGQELITAWDMEADSRPMRVTNQYLLEEAKRLRSEIATSDSLKAEQRGFTLDLAKRMVEVAEQNTQDPATITDFEQLPTSKKYGKLAGAFVRKEIFEDLTGAFKLQSGVESNAEKILGDAGIMAKAGRFFKVSKTAANLPAGHVRNFISALINAYMADVPMTRLMPGVKDMISDYKNEGPIKKIMEQYGVLGSSFAANEMAQVEVEFIEAQKRTQTEGDLSFLGTAFQFGNVWGRKGLRKIVDMYGLGDDLVKMVVIDDAINRRGLTPSEAVALAEDSIFDYSLVSQNVRYLRNAATGIPFATYLTKSVPFILKTIINRPWKMVPFVILGNVMSEWTKSAFDWDEDDMKAARMALPEYLREKDTNLMIGNWVPASILPLPYKDEQGRLQFYDLSYVMPWGQMSQLIAEFGTGEFAKGVKTLGLFGSPMANIISVVQTGIDPFSRKSVVPPGADSVEEFFSYVKYAANLMFPPALHTDFGVLRKAYDACTGAVDIEGDLKATAGQTLGRTFGVNITPVDPRDSRSKNIRFMERELADIKRARNRTRKELVRNKAPRQEIKEAMDDFRDRINEKRQEIQEYKKASIIKKAA